MTPQKVGKNPNSVESYGFSWLRTGGSGAKMAFEMPIPQLQAGRDRVGDARADEQPIASRR